MGNSSLAGSSPAASRREGARLEGTSLEGTLERLGSYWSERGCLRLPAVELELPTASMHSEIFFRLLDAEPWRAQVLQPVRRPRDGRRARHPFRLVRHLQFQVILDPAPEDVQEMMAGSLSALGLAVREHDLRYHAREWRTHALDMCSLGWRVELDGVAIARLGFLQRLAGRRRQVAALEVTFGVERLAMMVGGVASVFDVPFAAAASTSGELRGQSEEELSRYAFDIADPTYLFRVLDGLEEESASCCRAGLFRLAYELAVKCLWRLDLLTTRGDLSDREREHHLERVRSLVFAAADGYLDRRAELRTARQAPAGSVEEAAAPPSVDLSAAPAQREDGKERAEVAAGRRPKEKRARRRKRSSDGEEAGGA